MFALSIEGDDVSHSLADGVTPRSFSFGRFVLIPERQLLLESGTPVRVGGRALEILTILVSYPGELVSKRELLARVWPASVVEDGNLKVHMAALRRILGEAPDTPTYIATVIGRGYRFIGPVQTSGSPDPVPAPSSAVKGPHNLPTTTTRIFGRAEAIQAIRCELEDAPIVSIVGAGGIGKTTVALAVAESVVSAYRDGVWFVDLSPLKDPALLPNAIATAVGLAAHAANVSAALCEYLRGRDMLIVLDSCEHMIGETAQCVDTIQAAAASVKWLTTSRESLRVKGERVRRIDGLAAPPAAAQRDAKEVLAYAAVQLFVDRATDRLETFRLSDANAPVVAEICRKLNGLALAIELAATRVDSFSVLGILEQLDGRFQRILSQRAGPDRHRTLTATIDWSYELLSDTERTVMRRLSAFAGAFDLDAACAVAAADPIDRAEVTMALANLVDKSLVATEIRGAEVEYRQWDTTRSYALERLAASGELHAVRMRHARHFLTVLEQASADRLRLALAEWLIRFTHRLDDIRTALSWAMAEPAAEALGVQLTVAAIPFWKMLSQVEECRAAAERALDERFKTHRTAHDDLTLQQTLGATLLHTRGALPEVKAALTRALHIAESLDATERQLDCLKGLSEYSLWRGDIRSGLAISEQTRAIEARQQVFSGGLADAQAGSALEWLGDLSAARRHLENVVHAPPAIDARPDAARFAFDQRLVARGSLATVLWTLGFPDQAHATAKRQLAEAEGSNYAVSHCYALLYGSAKIALYLRDYAAANHFIHLGEQQAIKHGLSFWLAMTRLGTRSRWLLYTGQRVDLAEFRTLLARVLDGGFRMQYPHFLTNIGEALARQGDLRGGLKALDEAIDLCQNAGQIISEVLRIKGNIIRFQDPAHTHSAAECYLQSIALARRNGALSWELRSAISLVKLTRTLGGDRQAEEMLVTAYGRFREGFKTGDLLRALALIDNA